MNKRCKMKVCTTPKDLGDPSTVPDTYVRKQPGFVSSKFMVNKDQDVVVTDHDLSFDEEEELDNQSRSQSPEVPKESLEIFVEKGLELDNAVHDNTAPDEFELQKSPQKTITRTLVPAVTSKTSSNIAVEFWQPVSPGHQGTGVISSSEMSQLRDLCLVCGSAGQDTLVYCAGCCQSVHMFCLPPEVDPDTWLCDACVRCKVCGGRDTTSTCTKCRDVYHDTCLPITLRNNDDNTWRCGTCRTCDGCGTGSSPLVHGGQLCSSCCQSRAQGGFCPLCRGCYQEDDYDQAMMECSSCGG